MLFRKIVSNLSFSPALVGQLGFYAHRLRKEEATRRAGLIFVALALLVQSFAVFSPPESANAANGNNIIYGGVKNKEELLKVYDRNKDSAGHKDIQEIYKEFGITRDDIKNAKTGSFNSKDFDGKIRSVGRANNYSWQRKPIKVSDSSTTVYEGLVRKFDTYEWSKKHGTPYEGVIGKRAVDGKWFAIMFSCGNPAYLEHPPAPKPKPAAACTSLNIVTLGRTEFRFEAKAKVENGATISKYTFVAKDSQGRVVMTKVTDTSSTSSSVSHKFSTDGVYDASVIVKTSEGNKSGSTCRERLTVTPQAPQPVAACTGLRITPLNRTNFRLNGAASARNGATISRYTYTIKDASGNTVTTKTVDTTEPTSSVTHNFTRDGRYTINLAVATSLGQRTDAACNKTLTVSPEARCPLNSDLVETHPDCKPCEDDDTIWYKDEGCVSDFELAKKVRNVTQLRENANNTVAKPGDRLEYRLSVKNIGNETGAFIISDSLSDVLEYADMIDNGGGTLITADGSSPVEKLHTISWPAIEIQPGQTIEKIVIVQIKSVIPATPQSAGNLESYNCRLVNDFRSQQTTILMDCPTPKVVEKVVDQLPQTGPAENMIFAGVVASVVTFFYARSRQLKKEVRLIRRDLNAGTV